MFLLAVALSLVPSLGFSSSQSHITQCEAHSKSASVPFDWNTCHFKPSRPTKRLLYYFAGQGQNETSWDQHEHYKELRRIWDKTGKDYPHVISVTLPNDEKFWVITPTIFQSLMQSIFPYVESQLGFQPNERILLGQSMGGFNVMQLYFNAPELYNRVAAVCPMLPNFTPRQTQEKLHYVINTRANWFLVELMDLVLGDYAGISRNASAQEAQVLWNPINPLWQGKTKFQNQSPPLLIVANKNDDFGFFQGAEILYQLGQTSGAPVSFLQKSGSHCSDVGSTDLANFLVP